MIKYTYRDRNNTILFVCKASGTETVVIPTRDEADKQFTEKTGLDPNLSPSITCEVHFTKRG